MPACKSRVGKIEKPRPLHSTSLIGSSPKGVEDVLSDLDSVCQQLVEPDWSSCVGPAITSLWYHIKQLGPQLEHTHKGELDRQFGRLRDACRDQRLDAASRVRLLELIELRAQQCPWTASEHLTNCYRRMLLSVESQQSADHHSPPSATALTALAATGRDATGPAPSPSPCPPSLPPLLTDAEMVRGSGRYPRPVQLNGRFRDELVIRNSDSGKVVHGAKERMIQVNGESEANVLLARDLIDDVIRRNVSPSPSPPTAAAAAAAGGSGSGHGCSMSFCRSLSHSCSSNTSTAAAAVGSSSSLRRVGNSLDSFSSCTSSGSGSGGGGGNSSCSCSHSTHSLSPGGVIGCACVSLEEYKYTVHINGHPVKLSCKDANAVRLAKVVLDDYFECAEQQPAVDNISGTCASSAFAPVTSTSAFAAASSNNNNNNFDNGVVSTPRASTVDRSRALDLSALNLSSTGEFLATSSPCADPSSSSSAAAAGGAATTAVGVSGDSPLIGAPVVAAATASARHQLAGDAAAAGGCGDAAATISSLNSSAALASPHSPSNCCDKAHCSGVSIDGGTICYDKRQLLALSSSPLSLQQPSVWQYQLQRLRDIARSTPLMFDAEEFMAKSASLVHSVTRYRNKSFNGQ